MTIIKNMESDRLYHLQALATDTRIDWAEAIFEGELACCVCHSSDTTDMRIYEVWHFSEFCEVYEDYKELDKGVTDYYLTLLPDDYLSDEFFKTKEKKNEKK